MSIFRDELVVRRGYAIFLPAGCFLDPPLISAALLVAHAAIWEGLMEAVCRSCVFPSSLGLRARRLGFDKMGQCAGFFCFFRCGLAICIVGVRQLSGRGFPPFGRGNFFHSRGDLMAGFWFQLLGAGSTALFWGLEWTFPDFHATMFPRKTLIDRDRTSLYHGNPAFLQLVLFKWLFLP